MGQVQHGSARTTEAIHQHPLVPSLKGVISLLLTRMVRFDRPDNQPGTLLHFKISSK